MKSSPPNLCPNCKKSILSEKCFSESPLNFCPFCGYALRLSQATTVIAEGQNKETQFESTQTTATLIADHIPKKEEILFSIGPYQVIKEIGRGGMGEVFLSYDPNCGRKIAVKRIRPDLMEHKQLHKRFLKEARVTSQLTHPAIIPIYTIHQEGELVYYSMPYVEGETLKQIIRSTKKQQKEGKKLHHIGGSIPSLIRIFITVCQAVAYAHSKGVLHRDLKPENIIIGPYGEVMILDWGLAKISRGAIKVEEEVESEEMQEIEPNPFSGLTKIGKVVGTVSHMAPERALGQPATIETDVYSLGTILYQLLTLQLPFSRGPLKEFRSAIANEILRDPTDVAPYRDVPDSLAKIATKCLSPHPNERYQHVDYMIRDLENYIEGRSEWFEKAHLNIYNKDDWEFQENVLIAEHIAITRGTEIADWVSLMISKISFTENTKLEARVCVGENCSGIGFLMSVPEAAERVHLNDGYCLWIGSEKNKMTKLLRSTVEVMQLPEIFFKPHQWYRVRIEKIDSNIYFYLDEKLQFSFISYLPLAGTHIGILSRDADFALENLVVSVAGQNIMVNCLAVPNAFLAHKNYQLALNEYRRIGYSFPGRAEGREALFRAGITLLEQAKNSKSEEKGQYFYDQALVEFEKLHVTPGAPLEYLGKAIVYEAQKEYGEEIKCFELACRRYPNHPLLPVIYEQIIYRMHELSREHRKETYEFILLVVRRIPDYGESYNTLKLFHSLEKYWEKLNFILDDSTIPSSKKLSYQQFSIKLTFWLAKPYFFVEMIKEFMNSTPYSPILVFNAFFSLLELGSYELANSELKKISNGVQDPIKEQLQNGSELIRIALLSYKESIELAFNTYFNVIGNSFGPDEERLLLHLLEQAIDRNKTKLVYDAVKRSAILPLTHAGKFMIECYEIWALLIDKEWRKAEEALHLHSIDELCKETSLLHFLYGCWLFVVEGDEIATVHFSSVMDVAFPRSWNLFSYYFTGRIKPNDAWFQQAFRWEKRQLYRQLSLFYHCIDEEINAKNYHTLAEQEKCS